MPPRALVIKFGGELLEDRAHLLTSVRAAADIAAPGDAPLVIVHGGGKEIDAALRAAGIEKRQVLVRFQQKFAEDFGVRHGRSVRPAGGESDSLRQVYSLPGTSNHKQRSLYCK